MHDVVAREARRHEVLGAVLDPLDRDAGDDRAGDRAHVARIHRHLVAEAAADVLAADADHVLGEPGDVRVDRAVRVRRLVAVVDVELAGLRVEVGDHPARLERRRMAARIDDVARRRPCPPRRTRGRSPPRRRPPTVGLARLSRCPALSSRISGASGSSALRALTIAGSGSYSTSISCERVVRRVLVGRDHERDLLALEADLVAREHGLRVVGDRRHPGEAERLEVLGGDDGGDVGVRERPRGVDRDDARVRIRAAQHAPRRPSPAGGCRRGRCPCRG